MGKTRIVLAILVVLQLVWLMVGCSVEQKMAPESVMQIEDGGLREGVFVRRYMMTGDYGSHKKFTPEILKNFIKKEYEPDYLMIMDAYNRGMDKEDDVMLGLEEFRIAMDILAGQGLHVFHQVILILVIKKAAITRPFLFQREITKNSS